MTRELLQEANKLNHTITELTNQIALVEDMHHCDNNPLQLVCNTVGSVTLNGFDELKDDIIDLVLSRMNNAKDDLEDKLRLL